VKVHTLIAAYLLEYSSWIFSFACWITGIRQPPRHPLQESAVVVSGAADGIGRATALQFARLGCTVFACCHREPNGAPDSLSSLLFLAQNEKERSLHSTKRRTTAWGSIIPLVFDLGSRDERAHALETVKVYCDSHSRKLCAVILAPPSLPNAPYISTDPGSQSDYRAQFDSTTFVPLSTANQDVFEDSLRMAVVGPVSLVQDCIDILSGMGGRVVVLSGCNEGTWQRFLGIGCAVSSAREAAIHVLRRELALLGIPVSLIKTSPLFKRENVQHLHRGSKMSSPKVKVSRHDRSTIMKLVASIACCFSLDEEAVISIVRRVVESRYPRPVYCFGVDTWLQQLATAVPDDVWVLTRRGILANI